MRIDDLTVALRPRSSWEAIELGTALVRRHARAIWRPWLACTLPAFAVVNALCWLWGKPAVAMFVMWWLKPLFDRVPLFVLSRAVFGEVPGTRTTLRNAFRGGTRAMFGYLMWRRLSPARALLMPVDVLEGGPAAQAGARRRVLAGPAYGVASLCLLVFANFEAALVFGFAALALMFIPNEFVQLAFQNLWLHLRESPAWLLLIENTLVWTATCVLEPFYVGSGFGQYLNRRTEIEGWDIELAFRRLRGRLLAASTALMLVACAILAPRTSSAAEGRMAQCPLPVHDTSALQRAFGSEYRDATRFEGAVDRAFQDPRLHPQRKVSTWKPKHPPKPDEPRQRRLPEWLVGLGKAIGVAGEGVMWALAGALVLLIAWLLYRWWPSLREIVREPRVAPAAAVEHAIAEPEPLPPDIVSSVRRLWAAGQARDALALLYRAAVEAMLGATDRVLPPGATESQCLRASQALPDSPRRAFARVVRLWQYAAWAERLPSNDEFETVLGDAALQFGWRA
ncbi:DUF4129 domain-containing protein [Lysobacter sp. TY2-98]|uniref:DUF4129 domain-containing protein n=1 Tax=Lysobacter sp. TY2-98 TaxID=2290922 RepID=UPI000E20A419|nr:DUF4129 domain-containing protein [Lysobacter sp. TY2-98]AXK73079.1 DUF4129 domain-containing protein [Lysobacter sp. TY2-98]